MNTEQELTALENELRALKATYPVVASNLRFFVTTSQDFVVNSDDSPIRIQFTPDFGHGAVSFTRLRAVVFYQGAEVYREQYVEPQDGSGNVILTVDLGATHGLEYTVRVIASGVSDGVFNVL